MNLDDLEVRIQINAGLLGFVQLLEQIAPQDQTVQLLLMYQQGGVTAHVCKNLLLKELTAAEALELLAEFNNTVPEVDGRLDALQKLLEEADMSAGVIKWLMGEGECPVGAQKYLVQLQRKILAVTVPNRKLPDRDTCTKILGHWERGAFTNAELSSIVRAFVLSGAGPSITLGVIKCIENNPTTASFLRSMLDAIEKMEDYE